MHVVQPETRKISMWQVKLPASVSKWLKEIADGDLGQSTSRPHSHATHMSWYMKISAPAQQIELLEYFIRTSRTRHQQVCAGRGFLGWTNLHCQWHQQVNINASCLISGHRLTEWQDAVECRPPPLRPSGISISTQWQTLAVSNCFLSKYCSLVFRNSLVTKDFYYLDYIFG